jgi:hypothetical protein
LALGGYTVVGLACAPAGAIAHVRLGGEVVVVAGDTLRLVLDDAASQSVLGARCLALVGDALVGFTCASAGAIAHVRLGREVIVVAGDVRGLVLDDAALSVMCARRLALGGYTVVGLACAPIFAIADVVLGRENVVFAARADRLPLVHAARAIGLDREHAGTFFTVDGRSRAVACLVALVVRRRWIVVVA